jgi:type IV pilus assembly protein PilY1
MLYAFDVTAPSAPVLKWKVGCSDLNSDAGCTSGMSSIGQTWSTPNVATLKIGGTAGETASPVVIVGGGYDNCEDGAPAAACTGSKGTVIYVLNASNGGVLASFNTTGRVPADVALVDLDFDNIPDLGYAVDTRGNVYRINFGLSKTAPLPSGSYSMTKIAYTNGGNRKFFYPPALLPAYDTATGKNFVYVAVGTGDREQPLASQYPYTTPVLNRFYVYLDDISLSTAANLDDAGTGGPMNDFTAGASCASDLVLPGGSKAGWFMDLNVCGSLAADCAEGAATIGEQTVTSAVIVGGLMAFSTNRAVPAQPNVCAPRGEARGYLVNLFNSSGAVGTQGMTCGGSRSAPFAGGGVPPSPVVGNVEVDGRVVTVLIGAVNQKGPTTSSPLQGQEGFTLKPQRRQRIFYRQEGNN